MNNTKTELINLVRERKCNGKSNVIRKSKQKGGIKRG